MAAALRNAAFGWGGEEEPHQLSWAAWEKVLFFGETQPCLAVCSTASTVSHRDQDTAEARAESCQAWGSPGILLDRHSWLQLKHH